MIEGTVFTNDNDDVFDGCCGGRGSSCLGVGGLRQSRKHLQRNHHHCATLQCPVRDSDLAIRCQSGTSKKLRKTAGAVGECILSLDNRRTSASAACQIKMK